MALKFENKKVFKSKGPARKGDATELSLSGEHTSDGTWVAINEQGAYSGYGLRLRNLDEVHWLHQTLTELITELEQK